MVEQTQTITKAKKSSKKTFYEMRAPLTSSKIDLYGSSLQEFEGKIVKLDLTRSLRGKGIELKFRVKVVNNQLVGEPVSLELVGHYIRRMIRKGTDYIEDSFKADCKDFQVIVKPFLMTRKKVSRAIRNSLRHSAFKFLEGHLKTRSAEEIFNEIITNKIQKELSLKLKKIYPLGLCEIRVFKIIGKREFKSENKEVTMATSQKKNL